MWGHKLVTVIPSALKVMKYHSWLPSELKKKMQVFDAVHFNYGSAHHRKATPLVPFFRGETRRPSFGFSLKKVAAHNQESCCKIITTYKTSPLHPSITDIAKSIKVANHLHQLHHANIASKLVFMCTIHIISANIWDVPTATVRRQTWQSLALSVPVITAWTGSTTHSLRMFFSLSSSHVCRQATHPTYLSPCISGNKGSLARAAAASTLVFAVHRPRSWLCQM